jgi:Flp pilus assembly protein TadD
LFPQAITSLREAITRDPKNATLFYHLGMAYAKSGDNDKARVALGQALRLQSDFDGADEARQTLAGLPK